MPRPLSGGHAVNTVKELLSLGAEAMALRESERARPRPMFVCCFHKIGQRCLVLLLILSSIAGLTVVFSKAAGALSATNQVRSGTGRDGGPGTPPTHSPSPTHSSTVPPTPTPIAPHKVHGRTSI